MESEKEFAAATLLLLLFRNENEKSQPGKSRFCKNTYRLGAEDEYKI